MLTAKEKRFIKYWEEQRKGGRVSYFFLYIIASMLIIGLLVFVVLLFGMGLFLHPWMFWAVPSFSLFLASALTSSTWYMNDHRFKKIIRREVAQGIRLDETSSR